MRTHTSFLPLLILSLSYFAMGVSALAIVGALPAIAQGLGASRADLANAVAIFALTFAITAPAIQIFLSRMARRKLLIGGLALMALGTLLSAYAPSVSWFMVARLVAALGAAAVGPVASAVGAGMVPREQQARALATVFSGMTLASVVGVPLSAWLADHWGWQPMLLVVAAFSLSGAVLVAWFVPRADEGSVMTLRKFLSVASDKAIALGVAVMALEMCGMFVTYTLISPLLHEHFHASVGQVSFALFMLGAAGVAGNALARWAGIWSANRAAGVALGILAIAFGGLFFAPVNLTIAVALIALWAVGNDLFMPSQQRRLVELAPASRGLVLALNSSAIYVGMATGSFVSGRVYAAFGAAPLPLITAAVMLAALFVLWLSHRARIQDSLTSIIVA